MEGWEVVERRRTPAEIREEFERLQREREERRLQQRTNPKGTISVGIDATDLFDRYEEEYEAVSGSGFPQIEINKMHISQSIEAPLTTSDTAILSGSLSTQNGNGGGSINLAIRRVTSAKGWGELEFGAGDLQGPLFGIKFFRNLTPRCFVTTSCALQLSARGVRPGLTTVLARNLDRNTMGYLQWRWGLQSAMNTSIVRDTKTSHFTVALQVSRAHGRVWGAPQDCPERVLKAQGAPRASGLLPCPPSAWDPPLLRTHQLPAQVPGRRADPPQRLRQGRLLRDDSGVRG